jgi:hypothetical protein
MDSNPLQRFFRQPAIYIRLTSRPQDWPADSLDLPTNGELPVYPMTAIDEITYRTPDALFNGEAVVSVIQSCIPNIRDAWAIPSTDFDSILVAIRIASYGHEMDIGTECPSCNTETDFGLDLRTVIDNLTSGDYSKELTVGDLTFYFRPLNYRQMTASSQVQFEQQKTMQMVNQADVAEEVKVERLNAMMKRLLDVTVRALAESITEIRAAGTIVNNVEHIEDFLKNCDRAVFNTVRDRVIALREQSELRPLKLTCPSCSNKYEQAFTLDMSRFFVQGS